MPECVHGDECADGASECREEEQGLLGYASGVGCLCEAFVPRVGDEGDDVDRREMDEQYLYVHFLPGNKKGYAGVTCPFAVLHSLLRKGGVF